MSNITHDSIPAWIDAIRRGDEDGAAALWERYFPEVVRLAQRKLAGMPAHRADPDDVALSVLKSIFIALQKGRMPELQGRDELWRLLCKTTHRKAVDLYRYYERRPEVGESRLRGNGAVPAGFASLADPELPPDVLVASVGEIRRLLELLNERERRAVELRFAGYTVKEIARQCDRAVSSIELYLKSARDKWAIALRTSGGGHD